MNYTPYADKAYTKLKQYGSVIMITHSGKKMYDEQTNTYVDEGTTITGVAIQRNYRQKDIDGTNIRMGDVQFMASLNGRPQSNDKITFGNRNYTVINVDPMNVDGSVDIFVNIQAR